MMSGGMPACTMLLMFLLSGNPSNELLDFVDTTAYWQAKGVTVSVDAMTKELGTSERGEDIDKLIKQLGDETFAKREAAQAALVGMGSKALEKVKAAVNSDDPEVAMRAKKILEQISGSGADVPVRRLMAIRTLGELKDKKALGALKQVEKSTRPFEAEYAARAMAMIEGKTANRPELTVEETRKDVWLLPAKCGLVVHARTAGGTRVVLKEFLAGLPAEAGVGDKTEEAAKQLTEMMVKLTESTGNVRIEALTMGISTVFGPGEQGLFIVLIGRGTYDPDAMEALIKGASPGTSAVELDGTIVLKSERGEFNFILDKGERFVLVCGPMRRADAWPGDLPVKEMVAALKTGKGGLGDNEAMTKLVKSVEASGEVFGAMQVGTLGKELRMDSIETVTLTTKTETDGVTWKAVVEAKDKAGLDVGAEQLDRFRAELIRGLSRPKEARAGFAALVESLSGLKAETTGEKQLTITGKVKGSVLGAILPGFGLVGMEIQEELERMKRRQQTLQQRGMPPGRDALLVD